MSTNPQLMSTSSTSSQSTSSATSATSSSNHDNPFHTLFLELYPLSMSTKSYIKADLIQFTAGFLWELGTSTLGHAGMMAEVFADL
ncbi:hypothetical protein IFR04_003157 [Cadophora malorum]|uniref:Uncharacterized protein n=1 Tax=Cadophora malorum TaxID=108018 RepID=A0A8H7WFA8_9HELO|nr:hypothetical protein IFR04_003157 [Cadophora malorum]